MKTLLALFALTALMVAAANPHAAAMVETLRHSF